MRWAVCLIGLVGCGRLGFGERITSSDAGATADAAPPTCPVLADLSDDFESGSFARWTSPALAAGGTLVIDGAIPAQRAQLYVDDVLGVDEATLDAAPRFDTITVGLARTDDAGWHVYVDDVVIAHQHIGCL